jgi:hypothetical protein
MENKTNRGCKYNAYKFLSKFNVVLCDSKPDYKSYCFDHLPYRLKLEREHDLLSKETRQKYLDLLHTGKSIGQAREAAGISFAAAIEITNRSIRDYKYIAKEAV